MSRPKKWARGLAEASGLKYQMALSIVRGEYSFVPRTEDCLVLVAARAYGFQLGPATKACRCAVCTGDTGADT